MRKEYIGLAAALLLGAGGVAAAAEKKFDFGQREYENNCASCHGVKGKGDGVMKPWLSKSAPDLTGLARKYNGVFPFYQVWSVVDGRQTVPAHGSRDMPVWGREYLAQANQAYMDVPYDPDFYVRTRIVALVDYVGRLQVQ